MKNFIKKLILGKASVGEQTTTGVIDKRLRNIRSIWNNELHYDIGIEKLFRLFLAISQFIFPGIYIKQIFGKKGIAYQDVAVDFYVLLKSFSP